MCIIMRCLLPHILNISLLVFILYFLVLLTSVSKTLFKYFKINDYYLKKLNILIFITLNITTYNL